MAVYFWDSNGIAKIYHPEIGTAVALQLFNTHDAVHYISRLSTNEKNTACRRLNDLQQSPRRHRRQSCRHGD